MNSRGKLTVWCYVILAWVFCLGTSVSAQAMSAYDFSFETIDGAALPLAQYKGKAVLVVNTASFCGFTPQYGQLEALWKAKRDRGLVVLGVPSNDFGQQEPGSAKEIKEFCESKYDVDFPLATKVDVIGPNAHPFYKWAAAAKGAPRWNFHKYLLNSRGELVAAFDSKVRPDDPAVLAAIDGLLAPQ
jgi:glutathione peroxidase